MADNMTTTMIDGGGGNRVGYLAREAIESGALVRAYAARQRNGVRAVIAVLLALSALFLALWLVEIGARGGRRGNRPPLLPTCGPDHLSATVEALRSAYSRRDTRLRVETEAAAGNWQLQTSDVAYRTATNWLLDLTRRTGDYDAAAIEYLAKSAASDNWEANEVSVPLVVAMCVLLTGFKRNDKVAAVLRKFVVAYPNPFVRGGKVDDSTSATEVYSVLYSKLAYQLTLLAYQAKHALGDAYRPPKSVLAAINARLSAPVATLSLGNTVDKTNRPIARLDDGFYTTSGNPLDEVGFVAPGGYAGGVAPLCDMCAPLFLLEAAARTIRANGGTAATGVQLPATGDAVPMVRQLADLIYRRLEPVAARHPFVQLRGGGTAVARVSYTPAQLAAMYYLGNMDARAYGVTLQRYVDQLCSLPAGQIDSPVVSLDSLPCVTTATNVSAADAWSVDGYDDQRVVVRRSRAEGFVVANRGQFTYEQVASLPYAPAPAIGSNSNDELQYNAKLTSNYVNYGCDYAVVLRNLNNGELSSAQVPNNKLTRGIAFAGQLYRNELLLAGTACSFVPIDGAKELYYTSHYAEKQLRASGLLDMRHAVHRFYVSSLDAERTIFCPFAWTSETRIALRNEKNRYPDVESNAGSSLLVDDGTVSAYIEAKVINRGDGSTVESASPKVVANVLSLGGPGYFCSVAVRLPESIAQIGVVTVWLDRTAADETSHAARTARLNSLSLSFGVDADVSVLPGNIDQYATIATITDRPGKRRVIVDDEILLGGNVSAESVKIGEKTYKFSKTNMQRSVTVPLSA